MKMYIPHIQSIFNQKISISEILMGGGDLLPPGEPCCPLYLKNINKTMLL